MGARYFSMMKGPWLVSRWVLLVIVFVGGGGCASNEGLWLL